MAAKIYPESGVELTPLISKNYDQIMNLISLGKYKKFLYRAIEQMQIQANDNILDLGCGTGRNAMLMKQYLGDEGKITGLDISEAMEKQFLKKFEHDSNVSFTKQRIDVDLNLDARFDKILISFVIHGFPNEVRNTVIKNAFKHLKPGGSFYILDFAEFDIHEMPPLHRRIFKAVECIYAFDYIERDWKAILSEAGFSNFEEHLYFRKYARLLKAVKKENADHGNN